MSDAGRSSSQTTTPDEAALIAKRILKFVTLLVVSWCVMTVSRRDDSRSNGIRHPNKVDLVRRVLLYAGEWFVHCDRLGFRRSISRYSKNAGTRCAPHLDSSVLLTHDRIRLRRLPATLRFRAK